MKELGKRTQALRELSDSLVKKNEPRKTEVYWRNQSPGYCGGFVEDAVELVVAPPDNAAPVVLRFMGQLEEIFHDNQATIKRMVPSRDWSTVITAMLRSSTLTNLLEKLGNMPDVEKLEAEQLAGPAIYSFPKRFGFLTRLGISPSKRVRVTLKQTGRARQ